MKQGVIFLMTFALSSVLYAEPVSPTLTREQMWEVFARFNPEVAEKARQDSFYREAVDSFLNSRRLTDSLPNRLQIAAGARNFEYSLLLNRLTQAYKELWISSKMTGSDNRVARQLFKEDVSDIFAHVWAVSVCAKEYQLKEAENRLKHIRGAADLSQEQRTEQQKQVQEEIKKLKKEIRSFKKNPGEQIQIFAYSYVDQTERDLREMLFSVKNKASLQTAHQADQAENLQIKSKHKKPVAK